MGQGVRAILGVWKIGFVLHNLVNWLNGILVNLQKGLVNWLNSEWLI
jgi:hypothetical protein